MSNDQLSNTILRSFSKISFLIMASHRDGSAIIQCVDIDKLEVCDIWNRLVYAVRKGVMCAAKRAILSQKVQNPGSGSFAASNRQIRLWTHSQRCASLKV